MILLNEIKITFDILIITATTTGQGQFIRNHLFVKHTLNNLVVAANHDTNIGKLAIFAHRADASN